MQSMVALFTTLVRLLRAVADGWRTDPQFRVLVGLVVFLLLSGTVFYSLHEWMVPTCWGKARVGKEENFYVGRREHGIG
jgi:hypothetical protein